MGRMKSRLAVFLVALAWLLAATCGLPWTSPSAQDLAQKALDALDSAVAVHEVGTYQQAAHTYRVDLTESLHDAAGAKEVDHIPSQVRRSGDRVYVQADAGYWVTITHLDPRTARAFAQRWVFQDTHGGRLADDLANGLRHDLRGLESQPGPKVHGTATTHLKGPSGDYYVTTDSPNRLVRIDQRIRAISTDGASDAHIVLDYPRSLTVAVPDSIVNPNDLSTEPAYYYSESVRSTACNASGCSVTAVIRNQRGAPTDGVATVAFPLKGDDGSSLGSCQAPINPIGHNQTEEVSCTVVSQALTDYLNRSGGGVSIEASVRNPLYDG